MNPYLESAVLGTQSVSVSTGGASPWLVTFGDLLTLLVCFFVTMISFGPIGQPFQEQEIAKKSNKNQTVAIQVASHQAPSTVIQDSGTPIAQSKEGHFRAVEWLLGKSLLENSGRLEAEQLEKVIEAINTGSYIAQSVTIESCAEPRSAENSSSWFIATNLAVALQRQLIDRGVREETLSFKVLGPHCSELGRGLKSQGPPGSEALIVVK